MMAVSLEELSEFIIKQARQRGSILGSQLGEALRAEFPQVNIKEDHGGLMNFVRAHCGDQVVWLGKKGADDVLAHHESPARPQVAEGPQSWRIFTNPRVGGNLAVEIDTGQIQVVHDDEENDGWVTLKGLETEDYRSIAKSFLSEIGDRHRDAFSAALDHEDFWPSWTAQINRFRKKDLFYRWMGHRREGILSYFQSRLEAAGLPEDVINTARSALLSSNRPRSSKEFKSEPRRQIGHEKSLRQIIHLTVDRMSESQLRRVWLPIGDVLDSLD